MGARAWTSSPACYPAHLAFYACLATCATVTLPSRHPLPRPYPQFACRSMDLPSSGATVAPMPATSPAVAPTTQPTWVVGAFGCTSTSPTEPPGVRCEAVGGPQLTPELFAGGSGSGSGGGGGGGGQARAVPEDVARQLQLLAVECDPRALGHLLDAFVTCAGGPGVKNKSSSSL